ncbi:MAG: hypothetical protein KDK64_02580 [Chlamydiia bacterium]|nr:hypothetical protein [Chlamydiia bacterium]
MKKLLYVLLLIGIGFGLGAGYREIQAEMRAKRQHKGKKTAYATHPVIQNKSFVVITYAQEAGGRASQSLLSALGQDYSEFRVIYINDGTGEELPFSDDRITFVQHEPSLGSVESLYRAIQSCRSDEVVVLIRSEELLAHPDVLSHLNRYFADPDVWVVSGEEMHLNSYQKLSSGRHYQAFYAGLFHRLKLQDFLENSAFYQGDYEEIIMPHLIGLSREHAYLIQEPLLLTPHIREDLSHEEKGARVKENPWHDFTADDEQVDLVVFSSNRPLQLYAFLESSARHVKDLHRQFVIYKAGNDHYEKGYQKVREDFPHVIYLRQSLESPSGDFAPLVQKAVFDRNVSMARYIMFAVDDSVVTGPIDLGEAVKDMKRTGAYGFYFQLGENLKSHSEEIRIPVRDGVSAWQFSEGKEEWKVPNSVNMALFRKEEIYPYFVCMKFHDPNILQDLWNEHADLSQVGLYSDQSKVVNLPLNMVVDQSVANLSTKELLTFFDQGLKMDITPLTEVVNDSIEIDFNPKFTKR